MQCSRGCGKEVDHESQHEHNMAEHMDRPTAGNGSEPTARIDPVYYGKLASAVPTGTVSRGPRKYKGYDHSESHINY